MDGSATHATETAPLRPILMALASLALAAPAMAQMPSEATLRQQAERSLTSCDALTGDDAQWCAVNRRAYLSAVPLAYRGDYEAQRNVAYMLRGSTAGVAANHVEACAWRLLIMAQRHPQIGSGDESNVRFDCGRLNPQQRAAAEARARTLAGQVTTDRARR